MLQLLSVALVLAAPAPPPAPSHAEARALAFRAAEWLGWGTERVRLTQEARLTGVGEAIRPVPNRFRFEQWVSGTRDFVRWTFAGEEHEEATLPDGRGWQRSGGLVTDLPPSAARESRLDRVSGLNALHLLFMPFTEVRDAGPTVLPPGRIARSVDIRPFWGVSTRLYIHPESGEVRGWSTQDSMEASHRQRVTVVREYGTAPFGRYPAVTEEYVEGDLARRMRIETAEFGTAPPAGLFQRPANTVRFSIESRLPASASLVFVSGYLLVRARVNANRDAWFLLDTGAAPTCVTRPFAAALGLRLGESFVSESGIGNLPTRAARLERLSVAGAVMEDLPVSVIMDNSLEWASQATGRKVEGILGNTFLNGFLPTVDYGALRLILRSPTDAMPPGVQLPLVMKDDTPSAEVGVAGGPPLLLTFDTGAPTTWLPPRYAARLPRGSVRAARGRTVVGLPRLSLGEAVHRDAVAETAPVPRTALPTGQLLLDDETGLLGSDILRFYRFSIDYHRQKMLLDPLPRPASAPGDYIGVGLWAIRRGGKAVAAFVQPFSAADRAGLRPGDEIVTIGSRRAGALSNNALAKALWSGAEGSALPVTVRSRGVLRSLSLKRERLAP